MLALMTLLNRVANSRSKVLLEVARPSQDSCPWVIPDITPVVFSMAALMIFPVVTSMIADVIFSVIADHSLHWTKLTIFPAVRHIGFPIMLCRFCTTVIYHENKRGENYQVSHINSPSVEYGDHFAMSHLNECLT